MLNTANSYTTLFVGLDTLSPVLGGRTVRYINLDNAASTPAFRHVQLKVDEFLAFYSSVHRGTGFKSQLSTHAYEQARLAVLGFVGADPATHTCIFGKNTTEAVNKLSRRFPFTPQRNLVLVSSMEHHSNDLPWRAAAEVIHIGLLPDGRLDEADFDAKLLEYGSQLALVAVTGASNVTGYLNPVKRLAEKTHAVGAQIMVDIAQLVPHRKVNIGALDDPSHFDFVTLSAHKMYAPFGTGALIGRLDVFSQGDPDLQGGGEVEIVTLDSVVWSEPPERDEAGSPNTIGAVALSAAISQLEVIGMEAVAAHETELTKYLLKNLNKVPKIHIYGDADPHHAADRLGVVPIQMSGVPHALLAAVLGYEFGIGVRNGCFCAHPYILDLLKVSEEQVLKVSQSILNHDRTGVPGLVRISFGLYNTLEDVDALVQALDCIQRGAFHGKYIVDKSTGEYQPTNWKVDYDKYFSVKTNLEN